MPHYFGEVILGEEFILAAHTVNGTGIISSRRAAPDVWEVILNNDSSRALVLLSFHREDGGLIISGRLATGGPIRYISRLVAAAGDTPLITTSRREDATIFTSLSGVVPESGKIAYYGADFSYELRELRGRLTAAVSGGTVAITSRFFFIPRRAFDSSFRSVIINESIIFSSSSENYIAENNQNYIMNPTFPTKPVRDRPLNNLSTPGTASPDAVFGALPSPGMAPAPNTAGAVVAPVTSSISPTPSGSNTGAIIVGVVVAVIILLLILVFAMKARRQ